MTAISNDRPSGTRSTPAIFVAVAWLFVGIPLAWGVTQTFTRAMALFNSPKVIAAPSSVTNQTPASTNH
jgi:hypothetical protein